MILKPTALLLFLSSALASAIDPCRIEIVDKQNGWPVPLVELRTTHDLRLVSDNLGLIAVNEPELLDREVWFTVKGHGYGVPKDGFGFEGVRTTLKAGGKFRIEVERRNIAKRLGRLTGAGRFAEGEKLGIPHLPAETGVFGCDSVLMTEHAGKLFWLWGDTTLPGYPLGVFHSTAATTASSPLKSFTPPVDLGFDYFREAAGRPRGVAKLPGDGPTWLSAVVSLPGGKLGATYSKIEGHLDEAETGLCLWDEKSQEFLGEKVLWKKGEPKNPLIPRGHPVRWQDPSGKRWILFGDPFPTLRCPDDFESWKNPSTWEKVAAPATPQSVDHQPIQAHRGSIAWSSFRKRWIAVFTQNFGKPSAFGEIWYTESESPFGPWTSAVKILTHDNYTFYNPVIQSALTPADASFILFEGTYTAEFADHAQPTQRYNYNQILYRLDLDDPKLPR